MATVLVTSVLDTTAEKKKELFHNVSEALSATFPKYSLYYESADPACVAGYAKHQVNIICLLYTSHFFRLSLQYFNTVAALPGSVVAACN